ncbi:MAG: HigA family addiction module antitoxin [Oceanibaculum nanhaiense]|uniref:HigA family addiction module antitoxin n=1 Tax=Oceanibaculum nanhaiense TaxID=1909734 RepID=UPI0025A45C82|nr:HigA family addiction module antitoxin [Oceanibaculum nanhaiense]MDM7945410.1 HigA family addiction module antitoxin [Oceanibaculum nanhaiense]
MTGLQRHRRPTPPGEILREHYLMPRGVSVTDLAETLGVSRKQMSLLVNGHVRLSPEMAARLAKSLGTTTRFWLNLQAALDAHDADQAAEAWQPSRVFDRPAA